MDGVEDKQEGQHIEEKGLDEEDEETIDLISKDGECFTIAKSVASMSEYVKGLLELDTTSTEIELNHVSSSALKMIIQWLEYHRNIEPREIPSPLKTANMKEMVGVWDANFVDTELEVVFDVLLCANFLNIQPLLELCCAKVASLMLGKTPKQIRSVFGINENFTQEEELEIRREFAEFL